MEPSQFLEYVEPFFNNVIILQMDLSPFINKAGCECLNEADDHPLAHCLTPKGGYLESDCDEQVRVILSFLIHSFVKVTKTLMSMPLYPCSPYFLSEKLSQI